MAYADGEPLSTRIADGPLPLTEAARITIGIVRDLGAAHDVGIVHRDIKPANLMLTPADEVKIVDFGLAYLEY